MKLFNNFFLFHLEAAGFTEEWSSNLEDRVARRQIEVQASNSENANRSTNYRTVTTDDNRPSQIGSNMTEAQEERKYRQIFFYCLHKVKN